MPCYDKKLEASREDFYDDLYSTRDVDCVITTGELEVLMQEKGFSFITPVEEENHISEVFLPDLLIPSGSSSGSYLQSLVTTLQRTVGPESPLTLESRSVRQDYEEHTLTNSNTGEVIFKGAKCYGFRNLQNIVRKLGREDGVQSNRRIIARRLPKAGRKAANGEVTSRGYDYVEIMACPGGCVNGGGQLSRQSAESDKTQPQETSSPSLSTRWGDKAWVDKVEAAYWQHIPEDLQMVQADALACRILGELCEYEDMEMENNDWCSTLSPEAEQKRRDFFRTSYRKVESEVVGLAVKW